jgi:hypothetical protein
MADSGYKMVADRHAQFVADHPNGLVETDVDRHMVYQKEDGSLIGYVIVRCHVWKDRSNADKGMRPDGTGHAGLSIPGTTSFTRGSEVENAETSALGRALAMLAITRRRQWPPRMRLP